MSRGAAGSRAHRRWPPEPWLDDELLLEEGLLVELRLVVEPPDELRLGDDPPEGLGLRLGAGLPTELRDGPELGAGEPLPTEPRLPGAAICRLGRVGEVRGTITGRLPLEEG